MMLSPITETQYRRMVVRVQVHSLTPILHPAGCEKDEAPVAQLDRVADFESVGRRFESYRARQIEVQQYPRPIVGP